MKLKMIFFLSVFLFCSNPATNGPGPAGLVTSTDLIGYWYQTRMTYVEYDSTGKVIESNVQTSYVDNNVLSTIIQFTPDSLVHYYKIGDSTSYRRSAETYSVFRGYYCDGIFDSTDTAFMNYFDEYAGFDDDVMAIDLVLNPAKLYHKNPV